MSDGVKLIVRADEGEWVGVLGLNGRRVGGVVCAVWRCHDWRQTIRAFSAARTFYGRQCRRCWRREPCPCLGCAASAAEGAKEVNDG